MIRVIHILLVLAITSSGFSQVSPKRGLSYGFNSDADLDMLKSGISWWYNWTSIPDATLSNPYSQAYYGVEYVPMVWNDQFTVADVISNIPDDAKYLLTFNEPNFSVEANMSPEYAASQWYKVEQVADAKGLEIVGPAVAWCGGGVCNGTPEWWYDTFFANCPGCRVDYIAFHTYAGEPWDAMGELYAVRKYDIPIWVTEFADWNAANVSEEVTWMSSIVDDFENDPDIYRYSWFTGRRNDNPEIDILGNDGETTYLGTEYLNATYPVNNVPGLVEAEDQYRRKGTQVANDASEGDYVGWTDAGTWSEYLVDVNTAGLYNFDFRIASNVSTGNFDILIDGEVEVSNVTVASTGGWGVWTNKVVSGINLPEGQHLIQFSFNETGTNISSFEVSFQSVVSAAQDVLSREVGDVFIDYTQNTVYAKSVIAFDELVVYNIQGQKKYSLKLNGNEIILTISSMRLIPGTYMIGLSKSNIVKKLIVFP